MKKVSFILMAVGAFLVTAGLLARFYAYERVAVMPGNPDMTIVAETAPDDPATYFDLSQLKEVEGPLENISHVRGNVEAAEEEPHASGEDTVE